MTTSALASVRATREVLAAHALDTKKALGQHFLIDDHVLAHILELANLRASDTVLEVGPGIGTLTLALLPFARHVVAIERDSDLIPVLHETCAQDSDKLSLIEGDALKVTREQLVAACGEEALPRLLVANLPYAVAATIVLDFLERFEFLEGAVVMVQAEVADRMAARPSTKDYGAYTVKLRLRAQITGRFEVPPGCFFPPPRVSSAVVRLERAVPQFEGAPASQALLEAAAKAADAAFTQRRKNIRNSFSAYFAAQGVSKDTIAAVLEQVGIDPAMRGEVLGYEDFLRLGDALLARGLV